MVILVISVCRTLFYCNFSFFKKALAWNLRNKNAYLLSVMTQVSIGYGRWADL